MTAAAVGVGGLALWRGHPARRCRPSSTVRASGRRRSILRVHLSSPLRLSVRAYSEQERRAGEVGGKPTLSRLAVPIKYVSEWRTSWEIVYAAWHVCHLCGDVMYVCHSIRRTDRDNAERTAIDIKAHTPLIQFVVAYICCTTTCGLDVGVVDLLLVCCTWPSICTKWRVQTIWVTLLACSSVYVVSAAIGLVLGLVLGLNLGLGRLCRKVGSIADLYALHAGSFIPLRFHFLGAQLHIWY